MTNIVQYDEIIKFGINDFDSICLVVTTKATTGNHQTIF